MKTEKLEGATPGLFCASNDAKVYSTEIKQWRQSAGDNMPVLVAVACGRTTGEAQANAEFFASAPTLLADRDRLEAENKALREALKAVIVDLELLSEEQNPENFLSVQQARAALAMGGKE